jgi:hypothetical protein
MLGCRVECRRHLNIGLSVERVREARDRLSRRRRRDHDPAVPRLVLGPMPATFPGGLLFGLIIRGETEPDLVTWP